MSGELVFVVEEAGVRLDKWLSDRMEGMTRSAVQNLIASGLVTCGGKPLLKSAKLEAGDEVRVILPEVQSSDITAENIPLDIVYEDEDLLVVNKPKGMVVHPAPGNPDKTLVNALLYHCGNSLSGINGVARPGIVHRIDKDTSGLLIVAKNDKSHQSLAQQIKDHSFTRLYEAVVYGNLKTDTGTVDAPIGRHPTDRKRMCVTARNSKNAVTHWEVVRRYKGYTHVRCRLETGRTHQIRVHMAHIGHPILGDRIYGHKKAELGQESQCLHAGLLCFRHPRDGRPVIVAAPMPEYFQQVLDKLERMG